MKRKFGVANQKLGVMKRKFGVANYKLGAMTYVTQTAQNPEGVKR